MSRRVVRRLPLLTVLFSLFSVSCGTCNPRPFITSITPSGVTAGGAQFTLTVTGDNFILGSVVYWNGSARPTAFVSSHELTTEIPGSEIGSAGTVVVFVFNPPGNSTFIVGFTATNGCGGDSNGVSFTISL